MKILQIGLGSMGKRRVRNQQALGHTHIVGYDPREDRRKEAAEKYGIKTIAELSAQAINECEAIIISTPPDSHNMYMKLAVKYRKPAFVEASVVSQGLKKIGKEADKAKVRIVPSATMRFHPAVKIMKSLMARDKYGKVCNFSYHMGQYLPDWHPWEHIKDFYVSKRLTSAAREMVPFEMIWITDMVGMPKEVFAFKDRVMDLGVDIDDTYAYVVKFDGGVGTFMVDVVARFATRSFILNLEKAQIRWNWEEKKVRLYKAKTKEWIDYSYEGTAKGGNYNKNIVEEMYVEELQAFFKDIKGGKPYPSSIKEDLSILEILEAGERSKKGQRL